MLFFFLLYASVFFSRWGPQQSLNVMRLHDLDPPQALHLHICSTINTPPGVCMREENGNQSPRVSSSGGGGGGDGDGDGGGGDGSDGGGGGGGGKPALEEDW